MKNNDEKCDSIIEVTGLRWFTLIVVIILNIAMLSGAFMLYAKYVSAYKDRLFEENREKIENLNQSAAANATALINSWNIKLNDVARYTELHQLTHGEALAMISDDNSDPDRCFELIASNYTGHLAARQADGTYPALSYDDPSYADLKKVIDNVGDDKSTDICFTPEFTDGISRNKCFAIYKHITLYNNGKPIVYTLLLAYDSSYISEYINSQNDYKDQSTILMDDKGNYIIGNKDFKTTNLYQYLYKYNNLTLDEKLKIQNEVTEKKSGELYYKNAGSVVEDCVFRYEQITTNDWYCVTCVPLSSYRTPDLDISYVIAGVVLLGILLITDVAWLLHTNRQLRVSMRREKEAGAAKSSFMSRMSHEIRTPLNAVIGYNTIARNEMSDAVSDADKRQAEMRVMDCLVKSDIASRHLLTIINDVLDMSAIESGKIKVANEKFDFKGLITSLTTVFYSQAKAKGVEFEVVFGALTEEWFIGDQMRTNQILTNLLANAIKFTPDGGSVKLVITQPEVDTNASHIHFEVIDTGIGMSPEYLKSIWTPFEQADSSISRRFGGTGLGLAITKNLVDLMHGSITVKSELGQGTTFAVDLEFGRAEQITTEGAYDFSGINALVVDDDTCTCDYIVQLFNHCGARSTAVTSGIDAVEVFSRAAENNDPYTVCLIDWHMPRVDGIETVRRIRDVAKDDIPMIVISAYDFAEIRERAASVGVTMFIAKPLFQSSLFDMLVNISGKQNAKKPQKSRSVDYAGARVLLAEDNSMNMEIAKRILESSGLVVDCAWNGMEAVEKFEASGVDTYRIILMDVHMPVMDGHAATRIIRDMKRPDASTVPIIAMTADAFAENVAEALDAGMNDHISKPIDIKVLFSKLRLYITGITEDE